MRAIAEEKMSGNVRDDGEYMLAREVGVRRECSATRATTSPNSQNEGIVVGTRMLIRLSQRSPDNTTRTPEDRALNG